MVNNFIPSLVVVILEFLEEHLTPGLLVFQVFHLGAHAATGTETRNRITAATLIAVGHNWATGTAGSSG